MNDSIKKPDVSESSPVPAGAGKKPVSGSTFSDKRKPFSRPSFGQRKGGSGAAGGRGGGHKTNRDGSQRNGQGGSRSRKEGGGGRQSRSEFQHKVIQVRRVTRVMAGGRRFSFSVALVIGNRKGNVGVGLGKASDTALAIEKAMRDAQKNLLHVPLNKAMSIRHEVGAKFGSSQVTIRPAPGRGLVAGSSVRTVLDLAGIKDITSKILSRSKNKLNNARAAIAALAKLS
ncbi:MAG: 30S ribosomal protein S5 [Candidatus Lloydbacteria bacterium]|nr:30S ribosomal protein S5 [Candidatus Lloydbacteria bacterium]